ncbi:hypothetical protein PCANC_14407 [Puccinia coronata f. sp. avenae]|uniref:Uncharacterized protein n=1 Tax=Puccinia coronata f. sp. avenae TaxID=200324 RepID=A0A2N5UZC6_9BASI|nr:hypothetical protein PCANC_14407 [Puccinia coronata f. sp. avenae]
MSQLLMGINKEPQAIIKIIPNGDNKPKLQRKGYTSYAAQSRKSQQPKQHKVSQTIGQTNGTGQTIGWTIGGDLPKWESASIILNLQDHRISSQPHYSHQSSDRQQPPDPGMTA